jgi:potassium efflux system protein
MESTIGMEAIGEQTRTLLKTVIFILGLIGLWAIWEPFSPALGILQNVNLWSYTSMVDGASQLHAITLADTAIAAIIITITIIAVRNLPGLLEIILLNRLPMDPGARYAYAAIFRYTLTAVGIIIALNNVGIRWSSLRWLVAALGVGIGFGLQEIVANFICGLIILFERPVRVGDIVTVGGTDGIVTKIRIRATTIRDWDLKELLVPNKEFITTRLLNWSLSDRVTRVLVTVGVAYGSDVDKAFALMQAAAAEHEFVLTDPEPITSFDAFGDNALTLTLRAYLGSTGTDQRVKTTTDLHKAINQKFADAGIEISYPQRDVHLDANGPLEVRVVSGLSGSRSA